MYEGASLSTNALNILLSCPGVHANGKHPDEPADYIYVNWQQLLGTNAIPDNYPLIYDRKVSNHCGLGINILPVNGKCFWDFRARWLKNFKRKHPEYDLPIPQ